MQVEIQNTILNDQKRVTNNIGDFNKKQNYL